MTKDEQKRTEIFEKESERLNAEGYTAKDMTIKGATANIAGILLGLVPIIPAAICFIALDDNFIEIFETMRRVIGIPGILIIIASIIIHELIHGFTWGLFARNGFKSAGFGFSFRSLTPYCSCKEPLGKKQYILGTIMPGLILGFVPMIIACITLSHILFIYGAFMTLVAGGDLLLILILLKDKKSPEELFLDHPTKIGLVKFEKNSDKR